MEIDKDSVPSTIEAAVHAMVASLSDEDREAIKLLEHARLAAFHFTFGMQVRNAWSLWDKDSPLKRDAVAKYRIAHADDISGLLFSWAFALVRGESFDPVVHCEKYHEHWKAYNMDSLTAGGWAPDEIVGGAS